jgi:hypothetical protein
VDGLRDPRWLGLAAVYVLAMALPFVPAIELGIALMLVLGPAGVVAVYACTQFALLLGFAAGRRLPPPSAGLDERLGPRLPRWLHGALRHRHLSLAIALNLPGNGVLGGAGGIALLAGASRLYHPWAFCVTVAAATTPVPLAILLGLWR